jgi:hypothetical protein
MQSLLASDLLDIWERGADRSPVEQALIILAAAYPRVPAAALANLTIGQRDACLLQLRALTFGPRLQGVAVCPTCGERLEMAFEAGDLQAGGSALPEPGSGEAGNPEISFTLAPYQVTYRLPTSADLRLVTRQDDPALARQQLLEACVLSIRRGKKALPVGELPEDVLEAVSARMGHAEPLADLTLAVTCPACQHQWKVLFDIVSFFWSEIGAWAARLMREVHVLASAYGWREADILALTPWRRQRYLELIGV